MTLQSSILLIVLVNDNALLYSLLLSMTKTMCMIKLCHVTALFGIVLTCFMCQTFVFLCVPLGTTCTWMCFKGLLFEPYI